jgi:hypothetical protein
MANWNVSFEWLLDSEDPLREYKTVKDSVPIKPDDSPEVAAAKRAAMAISGINSYYWPLQFAKIDALPPDQRRVEIENFYQAAFWNQWFAQIDSDEVAKRVFDMTVNGGAGTEIKLLQQAFNAVAAQTASTAHLTVDGQLGPATVTAVNAVNLATLVAAFQKAQEDHYRAIVSANPADAKYLAGWLARAKR